jgi:hypothetical protein
MTSVVRMRTLLRVTVLAAARIEVSRFHAGICYGGRLYRRPKLIQKLI